MKLKLIILAILVALMPAAAMAKKEKKPKTEDRLEQLEALTEYLLTRSSLTSNNFATDSADCGLTVDFDGFGSTIARDTVPTSVTGPVTGILKFQPGLGCDPLEFAAAADPSDIIAVSRGVCPFAQKVQNAADAGYGAVLIFNNGEAFNFEGQLLVSMGTPDGSPFALPTVALNARDGIDMPALDGIPVTINGPAQFCTTAE